MRGMVPGLKSERHSPSKTHAKPGFERMAHEETMAVT